MITAEEAKRWMNDHKAKDKWPKDMSRIHRVEVKEDGWRIIIIKNGPNIQAITRKGDDIWPKIAHAFDELYKIDGSWMLDGELTTNGPASTIPTQLKYGTREWQYHVFAAPSYNGAMVDGWRSQDQHCRFFETLTPNIHKVNSMSVMSMSDLNSSQLQHRAVKYGLEGFVLKEEPFGPWYKVKPTYTVDMIVQHVEEGKGRLKGTAGTLVCRFTDHPDFAVRVGGGLTDGLRRYWYDLETCGQVIEVEFQAVQKNSLQFPRFVRERPDKPIAERTYSQLEGIRRA